MMKAVFVKGQDKISVDDVMTPVAGEHDIVVKMHACGICGSDLEKVYSYYSMSSNRLGHEPAGEVIGVGKSISGFSINDRVFVHHHVSCLSCHYCQHGDNTMCEMYQKSNIEPCGLSQTFLVPEWNISRGGIIKLPDEVTFDEATLIEPLACCIRALNKSHLQKGDDVAVMGVGPAGMMNIILATNFGAAKIIAIDVNGFRLNFASRHNTNIETINPSTEKSFVEKIHNMTYGRGVDVTIVSTGNMEALIRSFDITRRGGTIVLFGVPSRETKILFDVSKIYSNELSIIPSYASTEVETNQALRLIAEKRLNVESLITHKFDIKDAKEAIKCAHQAKDTMKVIITSC
jgi:L-iditol 2-dehydrogenase